MLGAILGFWKPLHFSNKLQRGLLVGTLAAVLAGWAIAFAS